MGERSEEGPVIAVLRSENDRWTWTFSQDDFSIESADTYGSAHEAALAARAAYPGIAIHAQQDDGGPAPRLLTRLLMSAVIWRRTRPG